MIAARSMEPASLLRLFIPPFPLVPEKVIQ